MRKAVRVALIVVLILVALAVTIDRAHACSCGMSGLPAAELEAATAVLPGKVLRADARNGEVISSADPVWVGLLWIVPLADVDVALRGATIVRHRRSPLVR